MCVTCSINVFVCMQDVLIHLQTPIIFSILIADYFNLIYRYWLVAIKKTTWFLMLFASLNISDFLQPFLAKNFHSCPKMNALYNYCEDKLFAKL